MARQHLGDRDAYTLRVPTALTLKEVASDAGYEDVSRYVADFLCKHLGRDDLVLGPKTTKENQDQLKLSA